VNEGEYIKWCRL